MLKQTNLFLATVLGLTTILAATPSKADITGFFEEGLKSPQIESVATVEGSIVMAALNWKQDGQPIKSVSIYKAWDLVTTDNSRNDFMNGLQFTDGSFSAKIHSKFNGSWANATLAAPVDWKQNFWETLYYEETYPHYSDNAQHRVGVGK